MALSKLRLGQLKPADGSTTVGDVYFPQTTLLLPLNGSNGGTTATDESNSNATVTFQGSSTTSTAQSKFGGSSLYVPNGTTEGVHVPGAGSAINLTGNFTIEWWVYRVEVSIANHMVVGPMYGMPQGAWSASWYGLLIGLYSASQGLMYASSNGSSWNVASGVGLGTGSLGTVGQWVHMALVRSGTTWSYYVDGTRTYTGTLGSATIGTSGSYVHLGRAWQTSGSSMEAYYNDFRITQFARYSGTSFTVPTTAHLTSAGDVNKNIIINSDADGVAIGTGAINQTRIAKAWINLDSTQAAASMIRESYNVSSMTDTATGRYTINFLTALASANYCFAGSAGNNTSTTTNGRDVTNDGTRTGYALPIRVTRDNDVAVEDSYVGVIVFGN